MRWGNAAYARFSCIHSPDLVAEVGQGKSPTIRFLDLLHCRLILPDTSFGSSRSSIVSLLSFRLDPFRSVSLLLLLLLPLLLLFVFGFGNVDQNVTLNSKHKSHS